MEGPGFLLLFIKFALLLPIKKGLKLCVSLFHLFKKNVSLLIIAVLMIKYSPKIYLIDCICCMISESNENVSVNF